MIEVKTLVMECNYGNTRTHDNELAEHLNDGWQVLYSYLSGGRQTVLCFVTLHRGAEVLEEIAKELQE